MSCIRKYYASIIIGFFSMIVEGIALLATPLPAVAASGSECSDRSIEVGGLKRSYIVCVPSNAIAPMPLVVAFHGSLMNASVMRQSTRWHSVFASEGAVTVYANACTRGTCGAGIRNTAGPGAPATWATSRRIDEKGYVLAVVDAVDREFGVDRSHVYAGGIGDAAAFAYVLACELPGIFAGVGVVAGALVDFPVRADPWRPAGDALIRSSGRDHGVRP